MPGCWAKTRISFPRLPLPRIPFWFASVTSTMFVLGAWYVNRRDIRAAFERSNHERRQAMSDLKAGSAARIHSFAPGAECAVNLMELGLVPGAQG